MRVMLALLVGLAVVGCDDENDASTKHPRPAPAAPRVLADRSQPARLPARLRRFKGRPVIGATALPRASPVVRSCPLLPESSIRRGAKWSVGAVWLSPEGLTVDYAFRSPSRGFVSCDAVWVKGRWRECGHGSTRSSPKPSRIEAAGGFPVSCFHVGKQVTFMWIAVSPGTWWTLVDHDDYWVAYQSPRRLLRVGFVRGWADPLRVRAAFVNRRGRLLKARMIRGYVAG